MQVENLRFANDEDLKARLLPKLIGRVFHLTTLQGYAGILQDGFIGSNKNGRYPATCSQSGVSYFRQKGCVSLVDLRNTSEEDLEAGLRKYYFLNKFSSNKSVFLVLKPECCSDIIPSSDSKEEGVGAMIVPEFEAGFKDAAPIDSIEGAIFVEVDEHPDAF